MLRYKGKVLVL